ncbi:hypothetical protein FO519_002783 [Halicephalobus sp. NKZ332]|nr:hypothetical protein FO519_002783 [Halicephalobus sp. NKZ332]
MHHFLATEEIGDSLSEDILRPRIWFIWGIQWRFLDESGDSGSFLRSSGCFFDNIQSRPSMDLEMAWDYYFMYMTLDGIDASYISDTSMFLNYGIGFS